MVHVEAEKHGIEKIDKSILPNVIEVHRDIAVPTDGLILRTNEITTLYSLHKLAYSADGFSYTSIPAVDYKGEFYTIGYLDWDNGKRPLLTRKIVKNVSGKNLPKELKKSVKVG